MKIRTCLNNTIKGLVWIWAAVLLYAVTGFYALPYFLTSQAPAIIKQATGRQASIGKVELNPFLLRAAIHDFSLHEKDGSPFVRCKRLLADIAVRKSLKDRMLVVTELDLSKPFVHLAKRKDGKFNFTDLAPAEPDKPKPENGPLPLLVERATLSDGRLSWEDRHAKASIKEEIGQIAFSAERFSLAPNQQFTVKLAFAVQAGGTAALQGKMSIDPLFSEGRLTLDKWSLQHLSSRLVQGKAGIDLQGSQTLSADYRIHTTDKGVEVDIPKSRADLRDFVYRSDGALTIKSGFAQLTSDYRIKVNGPNWQVAAGTAAFKASGIALSGFGLQNAHANVDELALTAAYEAGNADRHTNFIVRGGSASLKNGKITADQEKTPLLSVGKLALENLSLNLLQQALTVAGLKSDHADIQAWLTPEGRLNYESLLPLKGSSAQSAAPASNTHKEPWTIAVKQAVFDNYRVRFEDRRQTKPVTMELNPLALSLGGFSTGRDRSPMPLHFSATFNQQGKIDLKGEVALDPVAARLQASLSGVELDRFQSYVDPFARLDVIEGSLFVDGKLELSLKEADRPDVKFSGRAGVDELVTRDQLQNKDFIKWRKLTFSDVDFDLQAKRYSAKRLLIEQPYARIVIKKDKTVNVSEVFAAGSGKDKKAPPKPVKPVANAGSDFTFTLDRVDVQGGASDFADLSLILPFAAEIKQLNGGATGISSNKKARIKIALKGSAYDLAPVDVVGEVSPYQGAFDVGISFHGLPMPLVSPYMVQFAGYKVEKGKLNLDLKYKIEQGVLTASNNILIDHFELGEKVENPKAVSLPLEMAVALLKDSDGRIKLDVPLSGSLDDPQFSVSAIVADALLNALNKVITSPFTALASLFEGGEDVDHIHFKAGKTELDQAQMEKLDELAKALKERPALQLDIKGAAFETEDWPALKDEALYDQLKRMKAADLSKKSGKKVRSEYVELSDDDFKTYIAQMFIDKFPLLAERSLFGTPRLIGAENQDFYAVAKQKLFTIIKPEQERLKDLASNRAQAIAKYIVQHGGIAHERVFILDTAIDLEREGNQIVARLLLRAD